MILPANVDLTQPDCTTGSPPDKMGKRLPCQVHIRGWPKAPRKLERTIEKMMTNDRFRHGGSTVCTQNEIDEYLGNWTEVECAYALCARPLRPQVCNAI